MIIWEDIAEFSDEEEAVMNKILTVLESELPMEYIDGSIQNGFQHVKLADAILKYDGIEINPKYRVVEVGVYFR